MDLEVGQLVKSLSGRDKGKIYLVTGIKDNRVLLADGRTRTLKKPKQKSRKHLQPYRLVMHEIKERFRQGALDDTAIRNSIRAVLMENEAKDPSPCLESSSTNGG
jgi:ribosomal protein L14E/L6E/L27E